MKLSVSFRQLYNHPFFDRLETRARRRALAIAYVGWFFTFPVATALVGMYWPVLPLLGGTTVLGMLLDGSVRGVTDLAEGDLDERQRYVSAKAFRSSYWIAVVVAVWAGLEVGSRIDGGDFASAATAATMAGVFIIALPTLTVAWQLPDEVHDA